MLKLYNSNYTAITISPLVLILFLVSRKLRLLAPRVVRSPCSPSFAILPQHSLAFVRLFRHRRRSQRSLPRRHGSSRFYAKQKAPTSWMLKLYNSNYTAITISPLVLILFLVSRKLRLLAPRVVRSPCSPSFAILPQHSLAFVRLFRHRRRSQRSLPRRHGSSRFYAKQKAPTSWMLFVWRRRGDSNSRAGFPTYALSRGASSPT